MPKERRHKRRLKKRRAKPAVAEPSSPCHCSSIALLGLFLSIFYLVLFLATAYVHHASPTQLFIAAWKQRTRFIGFRSADQDQEDIEKIAELEMQTKGSTLEEGSQSDDVAVALPLETPEDVRGIWTRVLDEKTNNFYYHNRVENTVTWTAPLVWKTQESLSSNSSSSTSTKNAGGTLGTPGTSGTPGIAGIAGVAGVDNDSSTNALQTPPQNIVPRASSSTSPSTTSTSATTSTTSVAVVDATMCGNDRGLASLKKASVQHFSNVKKPVPSSTSALWLRVVMISHGRHTGGFKEKFRPQEDMLRAVRTLMMDAATSGGSPFGSSLGVVVANLAGPNNNPGYESARKEALGTTTITSDGSGGNTPTSGTKQFDFVDSGFDLIGSCGSSARRDFFAALEIGLHAGPCEHLLLLEAGESLCPSALLMMYYAVQKANDYDPTWSTLRVGKGKHGYGGLIVRCKAAKDLLLHPDALGGTVKEQGESSDEVAELAATEMEVKTFTNDLAKWMRKERKRTILSLLPDRPIGGAFAYRYRLISENLIGEGCGSSVDLSTLYNDLSFHGDSKCNNNDISPCAAAENDAWLEYKPPNIPSVIGSHIRLVIGRPGQSCSDACQKQGAMTCLSGHSVKRNLNDCSTLRGRFPCPSGCVSLTAGANNWPVPSQLTSNTKINGVSVYKGTCIIRQNGPMSLCSASSR
jgi:hypothetical protein